jgi:hypothetical protein
LNGWAKDVEAVSGKRAQPPYPLAQYGSMTPLFEEANLPDETIGSLGALGSDGNLWVTLPDGGTPVDATLNAPRNFYAYSLSSQEYRLFVQANSYFLWPDHVNPNANFCVGQYIQFTPVWSPSLPSGTEKSPIQWAFGGTFVNTFTNADALEGDDDDDFPESSRNYFEDTSLLNNETTAAWWVSGGFNPSATYAATVGEGLTFPNGQYLAIATHGLFTMFRPKVINFTGGSADINFDSISAKKSLYAVFGCTAFVCDTNFPGSAFYTQLINRAETNNINLLPWMDHEYTGGFVLDVDSPYGLDTPMPFPDAAAPVAHNDSPSIKEGIIGSFVDYVYCKDSFKVYLQFEPTGGNSIPITLGRIDWGWEGLAQYTSGAWSLTINNPSGPTPDWTDDSFPSWTTVRHQ